MTRSSISGRRGALAPLLLLSLLAAGCGGGRDQPAVASPVPDATIRQQVEARLAAEPALREQRVRVEARGGMVVLHGSVEGIAAWQCALRNAGLVEGVLSVTDYLVIEAGPREITCLAARASPA
jgi:hypothetical protein